MENKLHTFLQSDMLERYVLGNTSALENLKVESYIEMYPEVELAFEEMQINLEILAKSNAVVAPKHVLENVKKVIEVDNTPVITLTNDRRRTPWYSIAASITALLFAGASFLMHQKNLDLQHENQVVVDEVFDLRSDIDANNKKLDEVMRQFKDLNNPETEKYVMRGNSRAKNLKTVAYINPVDKTSMIDVVTLPQINDNEDYHLWAEMEDHFVSLGILNPAEKKMQSMPYMENALGLSITIEPKGTKNSNSDNAVAEIELNNNKNN
ncbi:anti-sigma factor [Subsaximicrobium wynnwilliamsii]|uniref:Anti-sigma factor n=1 Tax=Subsaximicrobium wynnwilliamsii TaxID=291179 RepID=A0A5C6ZJB1_9FLAO|nr:anti-sigma factor [Subsaximicrobium wynnwilliamsii]TXD84582.1 anti-sigma factor [Subsaximicrobium wynnwilliamsii]TXD90264.1 anti-sigma factor [Subsaximicrobium wynnwilliamsii]TXE04315.1 anti-sigma factor [Subsaximicrobium wynnwilliamsii]